MYDELKAMLVFNKVAELGSFRSAADCLSVSPSVISYHIQNLEKKLDVKLLHRTTRKLQLTLEGKKLHTSCQEIELIANSCLNEISSVPIAPKGILKLSLPAAIIHTELTDKLAQYALDYPEVKLCLHYSDHAYDLLDNQYDLAIRVGGPGSGELKRRNLFLLQRCLVASPKLIDRLGKPKNIQALQSYPWVSLEQLPSKKEFTKNGNSHWVSFKSSIQTNSVEAMYRLTLAGVGLASPTKQMVEQALSKGLLVEILPSYQVTPLQVYAQWPAGTTAFNLIEHVLNAISC